MSSGIYFLKNSGDHAADSCRMSPRMILSLLILCTRVLYHISKHYVLCLSSNFILYPHRQFLPVFSPLVATDKGHALPVGDVAACGPRIRVPCPFSRLQPAWRMGQRSERADSRPASGGVRCLASNVALRQMQREGLYDLLFLCSLYSHVYLYTRYSSIRNHEFLEIRIYCLLFWKISSRPAFCSCFTGTV